MTLTLFSELAGKSVLQLREFARCTNRCYFSIVCSSGFGVQIEMCVRTANSNQKGLRCTDGAKACGI
jgi:hypothetical protein